jgi:hypothetical protein
MLFLALVTLALLSQGILSLVEARRARANGFAGARWVWISAAPERAPVRFTAFREFSLPAAPSRATARIFVDPRFALWLNGSLAGAGGQRPGDPPVELDVARLLRKGNNTVAIVAESPDGVGGILFSLETGGANPPIVSGPDWSIDPTGRSPTPSGSRRAAVLGRPPLYPWGYAGGR